MATQGNWHPSWVNAKDEAEDLHHSMHYQEHCISNHKEKQRQNGFRFTYSFLFFSTWHQKHWNLMQRKEKKKSQKLLNAEQEDKITSTHTWNRYSQLNSFGLANSVQRQCYYMLAPKDVLAVASTLHWGNLASVNAVLIRVIFHI